MLADRQVDHLVGRNRTWAGSRLGIAEPYDFVRILLAILLVAAGALKGYDLIAEPTAGEGLLGARWFVVAWTEFEIAFGVWLLVGYYPRGSRNAAVVCFSLFAAVSLYRGMSGAASCGCFGKASISPWWTLVVDLVALVSLALFRPKIERLPADRSSGVPGGGRSLACSL